MLDACEGPMVHLSKCVGRLSSWDVLLEIPGEYILKICREIVIIARILKSNHSVFWFRIRLI